MSLENNPYFVRLRSEPLSQHDFLHTQSIFYYAVRQWPYHFVQMMLRLGPEHHTINKILMENVTDEFGLAKESSGTASIAHTETFCHHLRQINEEFDLNDLKHLEHHPYVTNFNEAIHRIVTEENVAVAIYTLASIEEAYVYASHEIAQYMLQTWKKISEHYGLHETLDTEHANQLYHAGDLYLANSMQADFRDELRAQGRTLGTNLLYQLYSDLEITCLLTTNLVFGNVYEDTDVELSCIKYLKRNKCYSDVNKLIVSCVASAGDLIVDLIANQEHADSLIYATDINQHQIDHCYKKLATGQGTGLLGSQTTGVYEKMFRIGHHYVNSPEILFNRDRLQKIFGAKAVGSADDDTFKRIFGRALHKQYYHDDTTIHLGSLLLFGEPDKESFSTRKPSQEMHYQLACGEIKQWQHLHNEASKAHLIATSNITDWGQQTIADLDNIMGDVHESLHEDGILLTRTMHGSIDVLIAWANSKQLEHVVLDGVRYHDRTGLYQVATFRHKSIVSSH